MVLSKEGGKEVRDYEIVPGPDLMYTDQGRDPFKWSLERIFFKTLRFEKDFFGMKK